MTIAGSDSSGGAGIQADLKAFSALGVLGTSAITCVTAQNPAEVTGVRALDAAFVTDQIRAICAEYAVGAAKTGMLYDAGIILDQQKKRASLHKERSKLFHELKALKDK